MLTQPNLFRVEDEPLRLRLGEVEELTLPAMESEFNLGWFNSYLVLLSPEQGSEIFYKGKQ